jgi:hypothetical protein
MGSQSQSQNLGEDARFVELLKPIKDLTQNFEVKCLTQYLPVPVPIFLDSEAIFIIDVLN